MSIGAQYTLGKDWATLGNSTLGTDVNPLGIGVFSSYLTVNIANGFALTLGIYIAQNVSGG